MTKTLLPPIDLADGPGEELLYDFLLDLFVFGPFPWWT